MPLGQREQIMSDANQYQVVQQKRFPWGCLFGGCLIVILIMMIGAGTIGYIGYSYYMTQLNKYTSPQPAELPKFDVTPEEASAVQKRLEDFKAALDRNESPEALVLTAEDINTLINSNEELKGKLYVTIADGELSAEASIPADMVPGGKGRYFNGKVSLKASLENGVLIVTLDEAEVNGESLPNEILTPLRNENLAKDAYKDPKSAEFLRKFERLSIEDDKIILKPAPAKSEPNSPSIAPPEPASPEPLELPETTTSSSTGDN
jgi:hypothetical protein